MQKREEQMYGFWWMQGPREPKDIDIGGRQLLGLSRWPDVSKSWQAKLLGCYNFGSQLPRCDDGKILQRSLQDQRYIWCRSIYPTLKKWQQYTKEQHSEHYAGTKKQLKTVVGCIFEGRDETFLNQTGMSTYYQNDHFGWALWSLCEFELAKFPFKLHRAPESWFRRGY